MGISKPDERLMRECFEKETLLEQYNKKGFPALLRLAPPYDWADFLVARAQPDGVDLDVSPVAIWTYCKMYDDLNENEINYQENEFYKFEIKHESKDNKKNKDNKSTYRGDLMTSAWTVWRKYLESKLKKYEEKRKELEGIIYFQKDELFRTPERWPYKCNFREYFECRVVSNDTKFRQFLPVANDLMSEEAKMFCKLYWSIGNCLMVPLFFNAERSGKGANYDAADRMLWKIYRYFVEGDELKKLFFEHKIGQEDFCKQWFVDCRVFDTLDTCEECSGSDSCNKKNWKKFLEVHLLQDFVSNFEECDLCPISFRLSKLKTESRDKAFDDLGWNDFDFVPITENDYKPMPTTLDEFENFFTAASFCMKERGRRIREKIDI